MTEDFSAAYDRLSDGEVVELDIAIRRLLEDPGAAWARAGRIEGDGDGDFEGAWILRTWVEDRLYNVYWDYENSETVLLIALVPAP